MTSDSESTPVFVADTCIGGLSVVKSLWRSGTAGKAVFLADYAINPLGVKDDEAIAVVADTWLSRAAEVSDTLVIACNTLSIRYHQLRNSRIPVSRPSQVVSMVDCFEAMVEKEADRLAGRQVLIIGTAFTASQDLYSGILARAAPLVSVDTFAATELERKIARFERWDGEKDALLTPEFRTAIDRADVAVLACTCFPMVGADLQALFPGVVFLDPGAYCSGLLEKEAQPRGQELSVTVTGQSISEGRVIEFARSYLEITSISSVD